MPGASQQWVPMVDPGTGITRDVDARDAETAAARGWTVETPEQKKIREYQRNEGQSFAEGAKSVAERSLSSATLGGSDVVLDAADPEYAERRRMRDETFKGAGLAGEALGYLAPGIGEIKALGLVGKGVKAASLPAAIAQRGASAVAGATERLIAREGAGVARQTLAKTVGGIAGGALEGAAIGAGQAVSESAIRDKELDAELLWSHVRDGAVIGGVLGGGISGAASVLTSGAKAISGAGASRFIPGVGDVLGTVRSERGLAGLAETKALTSFGALGSDIKRLVKEGRDPNAIGRRILEEADFAGEGAIGRAVKHDLESAASTAKERVAFWGEEVGKVHKALESSGQRVEVGSVLRRVDDDILEPLRKSNYGGDAEIARAIERDLAPLRKRVETAEGYRAAQNAMRSLREQVEELQTLKRTDPLKAEAGASVLRGSADAIKDHMREVGLGNVIGDVDSIVSSATKLKGAAQLSKLGKAFDRADSAVGKAVSEFGSPSLSYDELWKLQQRVGKDVSSWARNGDPRLTAYQQLYHSLKTQIEEQAERSSLRDAFKQANSGFHDWKAVEKIATERAGSVAGNRSVGLTDTIAGAGGASLGAVLGGGLGAAIGGVAVGSANRFIRSAAGDRMAATLANRYRNLGRVRAVRDEAAIALRDTAQSTVKAVAMPQKITGLSTRIATEFDRQRQNMIDMVAEQDRILESVTAQLRPVQDVDQDLMSATVRVGQRGAAYLQSILPKEAGFDDVPAMASKASRVPDSEAANWLRVAKVVRKPTEAFDAARKGTLTPEQADGLRQAYPSLHQAIQRSVTDGVAKKIASGKAPRYQDRLQLSTLSGVPMDATLRPEVIGAYQAMHKAIAAASPAPGPPKPSAAARKYSSRRTNLTDREVL